MLRYVRSKSSIKDQLSDLKYFGISVALIVGNSTLMIAEIFRVRATKMMDGALKISSSVWKMNESDLKITLRPLRNLGVCTTTWLNGWLERRKNKNLKKEL